MAEELQIKADTSKREKYDALAPQIQGLTYGEQNTIANLANVAAALKQTFDFFWVGFYLVDGGEELVLGPFQGPIACTRIKKGKGVCGTCWEKNETIIVPDVDAFAGHIACSSDSKSEIVVPVLKDDRVVAILDVDSDKLDNFDADDKEGLEKIVSLLN